MDNLTNYFTSDKKYQQGTVVMCGTTHEITAVNILGTIKLLGIADYYDHNISKQLVILMGRCKGQVVGRVNKGELLVSASTEGCAVRAGNNPTTGSVLGYSLEDKTSGGIELIDVLVCRM